MSHKIIDIVCEPAREGEIVEPLNSLQFVLIEYAAKILNPENGFNLTKQNVIDLYNIKFGDLSRVIDRHLTQTGALVNENRMPQKAAVPAA